MTRLLALLAILLGLCAPTYAQTYRPLATGPITVLVDPVNGNDANNCVTASCRTIGRAMQYLYSIDLRGYTATVSGAPGIYAESVTIYDLMVGQGGGTAGLNFLGNPANPWANEIAPPAGPAFGINSGAKARVNGWSANMLRNNPAGQDAIQVQNSGQLDLLSFGFGPNLNPYGDITVTGAGSNLTVLPWSTSGSLQSYSIAKPSWTVNAQAPGPGSSYTSIYVSSCANIVPGMTVWGPHISLNTVTVSCAGNVLALNNAVIIGFNPQTIYLCQCGQHHVAVSANATFSYGTNAGATPFEINIAWAADYYSAWFVVSMNATANLGATFNSVNNTAGVRYWVYLNGVLNSGSQGLAALPGDTTVAPWSGGQVQ